MSQDLMQALSGSSLLSLSIGTLPARKQGMSLDANLFASQLAQMTGADAAVPGALAPAAVIPATADGAFAVALDEISGRVRAPMPEVSGTAASLAGPATVAPVAVTPQIVDALPDDASASQIIEAALAGVPSPTDPLPVAAKPAAPLTVLPVARAVARPIEASEAPMPAEAALTLAPETVVAQDGADTAAEMPRPHRRAKADAPVAAAETATPIAMAQAPAQQPVARADIPVTELGTTRIAGKAALQAPRQVALDEATTLPTRHGLAMSAEGTDTAPLPQTVTAQAEPIAQATRSPHAEMPSEAVTMPIAQPVDAAAIPAAPVTSDAHPAVAPAPVTAPVLSERAQVAPTAVSATAGQGAPTMPMPATPVQAGAPAASLDAGVQAAAPAPAAPIASAAPVAPSVAATTQPASPEVPAQAQAQAQIQPQQAQTTPALRGSPAASRGAFTPSARRTIDAAVQASRPAEALTALFDRADFDIDAAAPLARTDFTAPAGMEAVPPSWAAALNAVTSPTPSVTGLTAAAASGQAGAVPMETLNFDAGFVANIETQIARVANGSQMVRMQIMPENLGRIDIEMLAGPERDQVRIVTEHDAVRDTLVSSQHRLEQDLRSNAQRPTEVTVELRQQSPGTQNGSAQQQQQRGQSGAETATARDAAQRPTANDSTADANPAARRPRGNVRYA